MRRVGLTLSLSILVATAVSVAAHGQPYTLDEDLQPLALSLRDYPGADGVRWTAAEGTLEDETQHLYVGGLSALSAAEVFLIALDEGSQISLALAKDTWTRELRSCTADDRSHCSIDFRTFGDVGFKISGEKGSTWQLVLLVSPEVPLDTVMPSPLFAADRKDVGEYEHSGVGDAPGGGSKWLSTVAALLGMIVVLVLALLLRRRSVPARIAVWGLLAICATTQAASADLSQSNAQEIVFFDELRQQGEEEDATREGREEFRDQAYADVQSRVRSLLAIRDLASSWANLSSCSSMSNPAGMPRIPSFCADDRSCESCYSGARGEFDRLRGVFEQLRTIYRCNKTFTDAALALGDDASGVHAVTGLAWQTAKFKILKSTKRLEDAYDQKYVELTGKLHRSMIDLSICEEQYGEPDWYDRFGFAYFEFIRDKYRRGE